LLVPSLMSPVVSDQPMQILVRCDHPSQLAARLFLFVGSTAISFLLIGRHFGAAFFHGSAAVVSHGIVKEQRVPPREIALAVRRRQTFESCPEEHAFQRK
jgi:hypothetical protein